MERDLPALSAHAHLSDRSKASRELKSQLESARRDVYDMIGDGLFVVMREKKSEGRRKLQTLRKPRPVEIRHVEELGPKRAGTRRSL